MTTGFSRRAQLCRGASMLALAAVSVTLASPAAAQTARGFGGKTGSASASPAGSPSATATTPAQQAAAARARMVQTRSMNARTRATAIQTQARDAARAALVTVPNGLRHGGLVVAPGAGTGSVTWEGAKAPVQTGPDGAPLVTVKQEQQKAILTWETMNVGRDTTLYFDQTGGGVKANEWIALNRIEDPGASPTQILGKIKAEGQVYVINRNGIIFGGASQVNTSSLVASALDIGNFGLTTAERDARFRLGLLANDPTQSIESGQVSLSLDDFNVLRNADGAFAAPSVVVEAGAQITGGTEGMVLLAGPVVENAGSITAQNGQVILGGGLGLNLRAPSASSGQVDLALIPDYPGQIPLSVDARRPDASAPESAPALDADGNLFEGEAVNSGIISTPRGNVTLAALNVSNLGVISSTTANNRPGTVNLLARDFRPSLGARTGLLKLGANSLIEIGAETGAGEVVYSPDEDFQHSRIQFFGSALDMAGSATIVAPSASMEIGRFRQIGGQFSVVKIGEGAVIDLSGRVDVAADVGRNIVSFEARLNELRDAPLQRDGLLYELARMREQIRVDIREGSALVDVSGAEGLIPYTVEQLQTIGGTLSIEAGQFFSGRDSLIAVAGGSIAYQSGVRDATTQLVGADGRIYDIGSAPADIQYVGLAGRFQRDHGRWGVTENFRTNLGRSRVYEAGYTEGGDAGSVTIGANGLFSATYIDGTMDGRRIVGERQLAVPAANDGNSAITRDAPAFGQLSLGGLNLRLVAEANNFTPGSMPTVVRAITSNGSPGYIVDSDLPTTAEGGDLSTDNVLENFGDITINGGVTLAAGESIDLEAGSSIDLVARDIGGSITARGGSIAISGVGQGLINPAIADDATAVIRSTARLSVAGEWVNNYQAGLLGETAGTAAWTDAGSITLTTIGLPAGLVLPPITGLEIERGAVLDLSGGGYVSADGVFAGGDGGDLSFVTDFNIGDAEDGQADPTTGLFTDRGSIITAFGVGTVDGGLGNGRGGTISFNVGRLKVGDRGDALAFEDGVMRVNANGWDDRGFSVVSLTTLRNLPIDSDTSGAIEVDAGAVIAPVTQTRVVGVDAALASATGTAVADVGRVAVLDQVDRSGTGIILNADGRLDLGGADTVLRADAGSGVTVPTISISSNDSYLVEGVIEAATGVIDIAGSRIERPTFDVGGGVIPTTEFDPTLAVWIADTARISARGLFQSKMDANGLTLGTVRDGGTVTLAGGTSYLVVEKGAVIDVSGVAGRTDLVSPVRSVPRGPLPVESIDLAGNAGAIRINVPTRVNAAGGGLGAFIDGTLLGHAGGTGARGGSLTLGTSASRLTNVEPTGTTTSRSVVVRQSGNSLAEGVAFGDQIDPTLALDMVDVNFDGTLDQVLRGAELTGRTFFAADTLQGSGIDAVQLGTQAIGSVGAATGTVTFDGDVSFDAGRVLTIAASAINILRNADGSDADAKIGATYVNLVGERATRPNVDGEAQGSLTVSGDFIDATFEMGFRNIGQTTLDSRSDIRISGVDNIFNHGFLASGDLTLRAQQIYPTTDTIATIGTTAPEGIVRFERAAGGIGTTPLSAGAKLTVTANTIVQGGVVRAPMGSITFNPTSEIRFEDGSLTSVSLDGNIVPYGQIRSDRNPIGTEWYADDPATPSSSGGLPPLIDTPPEKIIAINGAVIDIQAGAALDLSGGGDILAYRFVPGPGGSRDVLARLIAGSQTETQFADGRDVYAIIPGKQPFAAPKSQWISDSGTSLGSGSVTGNARNATNSYVGDSVELKGVPGIPDGTYTLLPGRYAMLPGAFRVVATPAGTAPSVERPLARPATLPDGTIVADGILKVNGTGVRDDRLTRLTIQPRETWTLYSAYEFAQGNEFFVDRAESLNRPVGRLARDAGQLALGATQTLQLNGTARFDRAEDGRGGLVDISAERIAITAGGADYGVDGYLSLSGEQLSGLGADSLLIGGRRTALAEGDFIGVTAKAVVVADGATLTAPELLLTAGPGYYEVDLDGDGFADDSNFDGIIQELDLRPGDGLTIATGASLRATGNAPVAQRPLLLGRDGVPGEFGGFVVEPVSGDSAILRLAIGEAAPLVRSNIDGALAALSVETGASLVGDALLLDGTGATTLGSDVAIDARTIELAASRISLGAIDAVDSGLALDAALVAQIAAADTLVLRGRQSIDAYGDVVLGRDGGASEAIRIETGMLRGFGADLTIQAQDVALVGGAASGDGAPAGGGTLTIRADALTLGTGAKRIEGFGTTSLAATGTITGDGNGSLATPGALDITAAQITLTSGSQQSIDVGNALRLASSGGAVTPGDGLGGSLTIEAASIAGGAPIRALGGSVTMTARSGAIALTEGTIDASGAAVNFGEDVRLTPAGTITLTAADRVTIGAGVDLNVSAATVEGFAGSGNAGSIAISAQATDLAGTLSGRAAGSGQSGRFSLTSGSSVVLDPLNAILDTGGFFARRSVRSGGDLTVGTVMRANEVSLVADGGTVRLTGTIDASGDKGGRAVLFGRDGVVLSETALIDASATGDGRGGTVEIGAAQGALNLGGRIDVGGTGDSGRRVRLRLARDDVHASRFATTIVGANSVEFEPFVALASDSVDGAAIVEAFESIDVAAVRASLGLGRDVRITPGVEIASSGDLTLAAFSDIDLHAVRTSEGDAGVLTLRAGGDLTLLSSISDGFDSASNLARPIDDESWSYRFAAGAALTSADPLGTVNAVDAGDVRVSEIWADDTPTNPQIIRTGIGSIEVAAAGDILLRDPDSVIYTAGRPVVDPNNVVGVDADGNAGSGYFYDPLEPSYLGTFYSPPPYFEPSWQFGGGDLRLVAGRDIAAVIANSRGENVGETHSDWLWRQGAIDRATGDFIYRPALPERLSGNFDTIPASGEGSTQTAWWINFSLFNQNFGVLGGGDAVVTAGRDFQGSVSIPTNARVGGGLQARYVTEYYNGEFSEFGSPLSTSLTGSTPRGTGAAVIDVRGGGDLSVDVGRDIEGGSQFYVARGEGDIRAGGSVQAGSVTTLDFVGQPVANPVGSIVALGDARVSVTAAGDVSMSTFDPLSFPVGPVQGASDAYSPVLQFSLGGLATADYFLTYGEDSALDVTTIGGDLTLLNPSDDRIAGTRSLLGTNAFTGRTPNFSDFSSSPVPERGELPFLAPNLYLTAFAGDLVLPDFPSSPNPNDGLAFRMAGSPFGQLEIRVAGDIEKLNFILPDFDLALQPTAFAPGFRLEIDRDGQIAFPPPGAPIRIADDRPALIYASGDIISPILDIDKALNLVTGGDLTDATIRIQHANPMSVSTIRAGRDIGTAIQATDTTSVRDNLFEIAGGGRLRISAERNIYAISRSDFEDLGIRSIGNSLNPSLPDDGAAIDVMFGLGAIEDAGGFLRRLLDPANAADQYTNYNIELSDGSDGRRFIIDPDADRPMSSEALAAIYALSQEDQRSLAIDLFFRELDISGREVNQPGPRQGSYIRGNSAVEALFPGIDTDRDAPATDYSGIFNLQDTAIRSEAGGDINVIGPGGDFLLGAISTTVDRNPGGKGVLTTGYGNINLFAFGDIQVGQSRVFSIDGGDILLWSSSKDINAGAGAKTAQFTPPLRTRTDDDANRTVDRVGLVTGSGIANFAPVTPIGEVERLVEQPGSTAERYAQTEEERRRTAPRVNLVAPIGEVDAGDAGIRSVGDLNIAALTVVNAANIDVGGEAFGVPEQAVVNVGLNVDSANAAASAVIAATEAARENRQRDRPSLVTVQVLGFGGEFGAPEDCLETPDNPCPPR